MVLHWSADSTLRLLTIRHEVLGQHYKKSKEKFMAKPIQIYMLIFTTYKVVVGLTTGQSIFSIRSAINRCLS